ncbi:MAG TPA: FKBP-type peptidyl-prolyl cis-trans isomerase [Acidimicrobiales bacterium]
MGTDKRQRQKEGRQARIAAAEEAKRQADRRRRFVSFAVIAVLVIGVGFAISQFTKKDKSTTTTSADTSLPDVSSTTSSTLPSAKGLPCVAVSDPLPAGAPQVPVQVGPPPTTLVKQDLKEGTGAAVLPTDTVTVNYIGVSCSTGKIFDSSYKSGQPATFQLDQVIKGWGQGIPGMKVGGQRLLGIPADLAYGANPPPGIAPDETLWFVVDVTAAQAATATPSTVAGQ